ncbi:hypothetical protein NEOLEDRAFT_105977 [Neolentinus lepideus HHB14362 ss-1]|uniref:Uncharacterized protein n=1 Tax=Neolentinus lepideus HHB14362 ss-1 TaxID=1314782 RepID=A0A165U4M2_9AGAM|nr:hypothetical protein NEOLEDRAFT_105977 [Neolentinus lepideus HHB14362 ss-1]
MDMPPSTTPDDPRADPQFYNRNPSGVNQHPHCPRPGDAEIERILREFHAQAITNRKLISQLLKSEYGIIMSDTTVSRRRKALGLSGQIVAKQFIPKATQEALRAHTQARLSPRAATADDDLFGDSPEPEPAPTSYIHDPAEASDLSSASPDPPRTSPPRKRRRARIHVRPPVARCLITLDHEPPETISKCFLIGHGTSSERIRQFEYAWGYEPDDQENIQGHS